MLKGKLYCKNNAQCYFATSRLINELSNESNLDVIVEPVVVDNVEEKINVIVDKDNQKLYSSQNPLRLVDWLKGFACCKNTKN